MKTVDDLTGPNRNEEADEALFLSFEEAAKLLPGMTPLALRKCIDREKTPFAVALRSFLYVASERRRWFKRKPFLDWLRSEAA